jgi:hypothetical protein
MSYTQDRSETDVFTILRAFIQNVIGSTIEVVRVPTNRVPMPATYPYVTMTPIMKSMIAWANFAVSDPATQPQSEAITQSSRYRIQIDAYGPTSGDIIQMLFGVFQSPDAFDFFNSQTIVGVYPLYADTPNQSPLVDGEEEYEVRWMMDVFLQYNPTLTTTIQTASTVTVNPIINVEASYH